MAISAFRERIFSTLMGNEVFPVPVDITQNMLHPELESRIVGLQKLRTREQMFQIFKAHCRWANVKYIGPPLEKAQVQPHDPWPNKFAARNIWGSYTGLNTYSDRFISRPLKDICSLREVESYSWPDPSWFDYETVTPNIDYDNGRELPIRRWASENGDYLRIVGGYQPIFGRLCDLCGIENTLINTISNPQITAALVEHITDFMERWYQKIAEAGRGSIDVLAFGDDFAGQNGMLLDPRKWRELFKASWKRLFTVAHEHGMLAMFHSCGSIRPVIADLIDAGMDIFEVVQIRAQDMDPVALKREYGADLTFYGAVDVQELLPRATPGETRREVRRLIDIFAAGGRFILTSSHLLWPDIPAENVIAMYDEANSYPVKAQRKTERKKKND